MKRLFDANLSHKLVAGFADIFPGSSHVRLTGLKDRADRDIWTFARENGFIVVTLDSDFYDLSCYLGHPPKVIWFRCGNQPTDDHERRLRENLDLIRRFAADPEAGCLELV